MTFDILSEIPCAHSAKNESMLHMTLCRAFCKTGEGPCPKGNPPGGSGWQLLGVNSGQKSFGTSHRKTEQKWPTTLWQRGPTRPFGGTPRGRGSRGSSRPPPRGPTFNRGPTFLKKAFSVALKCHATKNQPHNLHQSHRPPSMLTGFLPTRMPEVTPDAQDRYWSTVFLSSASPMYENPGAGRNGKRVKRG